MQQRIRQARLLSHKIYETEGSAVQNREQGKNTLTNYGRLKLFCLTMFKHKEENPSNLGSEDNIRRRSCAFCLFLVSNVEDIILRSSESFSSSARSFERSANIGCNKIQLPKISYQRRRSCQRRLRSDRCIKQGNMQGSKFHNG